MKFVLAVLLAAIATAGALSSLPTSAQESPTVTDEQIAHIKNACPAIIATLSQIHANDAPVYVNRNQAYFSISDKLIARLNGRLAVNRFDTSTFVRISNEYAAALTQFRAAYKRYDDSMSDLVRMNCVRQPVGFYDKVAETRELRAGVQQSIKKLHGKIDEYRSAVGTFQEQNESRLKGVTND